MYNIHPIVIEMEIMEIIVVPVLLIPSAIAIPIMSEKNIVIKMSATSIMIDIMLYEFVRSTISLPAQGRRERYTQ